MTCLRCNGWGTVTADSIDRQPGQYPSTNCGTVTCPACKGRGSL